MKKEKVLNKVKAINKDSIKNIDKKYIYIGAFVLLVLVAGCHFYGQRGTNMGMPMVNATVAVAEEGDITNSKSYVGLVEAINSVDVVAQVSGSLDKVNFTEGSFVTKDDTLFVIDKERYQANYNLAQAQLESAEANLTKTERDYERQKQLSSKNIASKATFDAAESAFLQAKAYVSQAKAQLDLARIDLDYTEVKAYIDGIIGKTKVTVGNFVRASAEPLARVVQIDPIRIAFSLTDKEFLAAQAMGKQNIEELELNIELASGEILKKKMENVFANNEVNMGTATIAVYADVKNEDKKLTPGSYVRIFVTTTNPRKGIMIPEKAIIQSEGNSLVFVVDENNTAKMRPVELGESFDGKQVILSGLSAGEKVMIGGLTNRMLRDGAPVNVVNAQ